MIELAKLATAPSARTGVTNSLRHRAASTTRLPEVSCAGERFAGLSAGVMLATGNGVNVERAPADGRGCKRKDPRQKDERQEPRRHSMLPSSQPKNSHASEYTLKTTAVAPRAHNPRAIQDQTGGNSRGGGTAVFGASLSRPTGSFGQRRKKSETGHFKVLRTLIGKQGEKLVAGVGLEPPGHVEGS